MNIKFLKNYPFSSLGVRFFFITLYFLVYLFFIFLFYLNIKQSDKVISIFELFSLFLRYGLLASGIIPLIIFTSWTLFASSRREWTTGFLYMFFSLLLHFIVTVFNAHSDITYYVLQIIEFIFLLLSCSSLYSYIKIKINTPNTPESAFY